MSDTDTKVFVDLEKMPDGIGLKRTDGNIRRRLFDEDDVEKTLRWIKNSKLSRMPDGADVYVIGTMPTFMSMGIGIELYKDIRIGRLFQSTPNSTPFLVFDRTRGKVN